MQGRTSSFVVSGKGFVRKCFGIILFPAVYLFTTIVVQQAHSVVISFLSVHRVDPRRGVRPTDLNFILTAFAAELEAMYLELYNHGLVIVLTAAAVAGVAFLISLINKNIMWKWMFAGRPKRSAGLLLCVCAFVAAGIGLLQSGIFSARTETFAGSFLDIFNGSIANAVFWGFSIVVIMPLLHEVIFRGIAAYRALRVFPPTAAILIQAVLFALVAPDLFQGAFAFALGIVLGFVYWKAESIWASFIVNAVYSGALILGYNIFLY